MKKFQFRLETLLKYREIKEERAQLVFAEADTIYRYEKSILEKFAAILEDTLQRFYEKQKKSITAEELHLYNAYIVATENNISIQTRKVISAENHRQDCLQKLEEAMKQRKLVENLKSKQLERHYLEFLQEEQKYLDEIGTQRSVRGKVSVI
ncbi:MAG: flagellar export protein FliJ [Sporomusaceae bacterium]|jgi:flagellar FliJ protein|nr:flagellar export protein FliJ [Sporomusaceae bacterium]